MLTDLTDEIVTFLNTDNTISWTNYSCPTFVEAAPALDPSMIFERGEAGLWICPVVTLYVQGTSSGREKVKSLSANPVIALILSIPFSTFTNNDVGSWAEIKKVLDFREDIDKAVILHEWSQTVKDISAESPQEIQMNQRWFLSVTELTFDGIMC